MAGRGKVKGKAPPPPPPSLSSQRSINSFFVPKLHRAKPFFEEQPSQELKNTPSPSDVTCTSIGGKRHNTKPTADGEATPSPPARKRSTPSPVKNLAKDLSPLNTAAPSEAVDGKDAVGRRLKVHMLLNKFSGLRRSSGLLAEWLPSALLQRSTRHVCPLFDLSLMSFNAWLTLQSVAEQVVYDDGDEEKILLRNERFSWVDAAVVATPTKQRVSSGEQQKTRKRVLSDWSDNEEQGPEATGKFTQGVIHNLSPKQDAGPRRKLVKKSRAEALSEDAPKRKRQRSSSPAQETVPAENTPAVRMAAAATLAEPDRVNASNLHDMATNAERFAEREAQYLPFLKERLDARRRRPDDPDFDINTLYVPQSFLDKLTGGQRQWWDFKRKHADHVLLFKMGKFYEMFEMDAHVGTSELGLEYMKGNQPHCGFPEKRYAENAERLVRKGYRVLLVEQVETPEMLAQRKSAGSKDKVVRREVCAKLTRGTLVDSEMLQSNPDPSYLLSITEAPVREDAQDMEAVDIGVCFVDTAASRFMLGQFRDDAARGRLQSLLAEFRPVEVVKQKGQLSHATVSTLRNHLRQPLINELSDSIAWQCESILHRLNKYFAEEQPAAVNYLVEAKHDGKLALSAFGGCIEYLKGALLDTEILAAKRIQLLSEFLPDEIRQSNPAGTVLDDLTERCLELDSAALENLEILENSYNAGTKGTLLSTLDRTVTAAGRRLLRRWICRPLYHVDGIIARQDAIAGLKGPAAEALSGSRAILSSIPDLERLLARLQAAFGNTGRSASHVVLYEDATKKRVREFVAILRGCRSLLTVLSTFAPALEDIASEYLLSLVTPGKRFDDLRPVIEQFEAAFDWTDAESEGRITARAGVDTALDEAEDAVQSIESELETYLKQQRKALRSEVTYQTVGKDIYLLEVPDKVKVPANFELRSHKKGYRRFYTPELIELVAEFTQAQEQREAALKGIYQALVVKFCSHSASWTRLVQSMAELDCLGSLAQASALADGPMCRPIFLPPPNDESNTGSYHVKDLRHPCAAALAVGCSYVPNDTSLAANGQAPLILLTGPNMGGKSTLLRQVCLAVILAQIGADVPATSFELTPVDRMFVRMGARDAIMSGQSTFMVELMETAAVLKNATRQSLVALDELGRGTATSDGFAIAYAVLDHLVQQVGCRGLFSTHYHRLADEYQSSPKVALYHMGCAVASSPTPDKQDVTFLYKLTRGVCPKSYGTNVALLAGMPESVVTRAAAKAAQLEIERPDWALPSSTSADAATMITTEESELVQAVCKLSGDDSGDVQHVWDTARKLVTT
eukprot:jgi/Chlat1/1860/Chrsp141S02178